MNMRSFFLLAGLLAAVPAVAQNTVLFQAMHNCTDGTVDLDKRLANCNAVVNTQGLQPDEMAIAYVDLGIVQQARHDGDGAFASYNKALSIDPTLWEALVDRGFFYLQIGDINKAVADYKSASSPSASGTYEDVTGIAQYRPVQNGQLHNYDSPKRDDAVRASGIAKLRDAVVAGLSQRCRVRASKSDGITDALADCNAALALAPKSAIALASLGVVKFVQGDYRGAVDALEDGQPEPVTVFILGVAKHRLGDKAGGDADIAIAEKLQPGITEAMAKDHISP
jgi:tetratricopeptide (TPR) repeat protein